MFTKVHLQSKNILDVYNNTFVNTIKIYRLWMVFDIEKWEQLQTYKKLSIILKIHPSSKYVQC